MENNNDFLTNQPDSAETGRSWIYEVFDWLDAMVISVIAVVVIFTFFFRVVGIEGQSMQQTLFENDKLIITNLGYKPKNGDIVVISRNYRNLETPYNEKLNERPIIKRVIATEFQTVDIDFETGIVYVDGVPLDESEYLGSPTTSPADVKFPVTVPENHIFVLGDNRMNSKDSRDKEIGMVDERYVLGHAVFRIYPFNRIGRIK
ncbi:MAG TPA: signal peptidase I [Clostridiales bacterium]|nr:signal peptidase I [Clostridiales bacterium]